MYTLFCSEYFISIKLSLCFFSYKTEHNIQPNYNNYLYKTQNLTTTIHINHVQHPRLKPINHPIDTIETTILHDKLCSKQQGSRC